MPKRKTRIDAMGNAKTSYLVLDDVGMSKSGRTRHVRVKNTSGQLLGGISWLTAWRRYTFFATGPGVLLDSDCLRDLAGELDAMMAAHKSKK